jgi:D-alanyl-D-alanine carboxypeptidase (penicillin-binding protein 5/6)
MAPPSVATRMMQRALLLFATAALACLLAVAATAAPPPVQAEAYVVQNGATGEVLATLDEREQLPIASITKLMTALVTLERAGLDEVVTVTGRAAAVGESTINLRSGERIAVRDLLTAALVQSANDSANALAVHVAGTVPRFVELMNERARRLGLTDTHFVNPDGLDAPGHVSSARDVTKLARVAMRKPFIRETVQQVDATAAGRSLHTWNDLLSTFPHLLGVKTGHTDGAGWSQVAAARGGGVTIYATLLGGETREGRNEDLASLLRWGLAQYRTVWAIDGDRVYASARTAYDRPAVQLVAAKPTLRLVRVDRALVERVVAPVEVALPVRAGQRLGEVQVLDRGEVVASSPLVAAAGVPLPDRLDRVGFYAGRTVHHLWGAIT